ncbi:MAG: 3'-5' exonuclease domain-containing protein 2 [Bdellovibrionales bacterium]|nr:3'-5' exonuclease domain-containing protein 2 [Bdellovibrionales bacterium]
MTDSESPAKKSIKFQGKIHLIASDQMLADVNLSTIEAFGFDTETKPAYRKGENFKTALLQLATDTDAYLFRMHYLKKFDALRDVFENPNVIKVGAAISHDLKQLQRIFPFSPKGFIDIQSIGKQKGLKHLGLKKMTEEVLGATLYKGPKMTNWERQFLTDEQMLYAATDAWVGLELYRHLK